MRNLTSIRFNGLAKGDTMMRVSRMAVVLSTLGALALGCAQSNGTIDRVQNNLVEKSDILFNEDGSRKEWYFRATTIDAPYASAYSFVGDQINLERGVFELQENYLYFFRSYTFTENEYNGSPRPDVDVKLKCAAGVYCNADGALLDPAVPCNCEGDYLLNGEPVWTDKNAPLLAFPIEDHVDVIWEYNPNTGERTNVKVENTEDRMWWEREFVRVKWGANEMLSVAGMTWFQNWSDEEPTGQLNPTVFKDEGSHPDIEPRISPADGYMDFVDDWIMTVPTEPYPGFGDIPICWFYPWYSGGLYECVSEQIRVRNAFMAVDTTREAEYAPQEYSDFDMERFGYFRSERVSWDKSYGTTFAGIKRYAYRFDIWERDEAGEIVGVSPVVYYLNEDYPDALVEEANVLADQWNVAFEETVRAVTGKSPSSFGVDKMFVVCENNLTVAEARTDAKAGLEAPCDVTVEPKLTGDLRYNFLHAVVGPTDNGLYGFGPMSADPLTGRTVTASSYVYSAAMIDGANRALNRIEFLAGIRSFQELTDATYISQEMKFERLRQTYWKNGYSEEEAQEIADSLVPAEVDSALTANGLEKTDGNFTQARLNILAQAPEIESLFMGDHLKMLFKDPRIGDKYAGMAQDEKTASYSMRNWAHNGGFRERRWDVVNSMKAGLDKAEFYDGALLRLADQYKKKYDETICGAFEGRTDLAFDFTAFGDGQCTVQGLVEQLRVRIAYFNSMNPYSYNKTYIMTPLDMDSHDPVVQQTQIEMLALLDELRDEVSEDLYKDIFLGVALHEVGHNVGLRHNFEASTDAFNFPPEYWDLKVEKDGNGYKAVNLWGDTDAQAAAGIREYQYTSVMDYFLKFNMPWHGLGLYDIAAVKYAYGDMVEVFSEEPDLTDYEAYADVNPATQDPGNVPSLKVRGEGLTKLLYKIHPTEYPNLWGDVSKMYAREDVPRSDIIGAPCAMEGADCGNGKVCKAFNEGLRCSLDRTVVPYRFGGDEMVGGLPTVDMMDEGVDAFEIVANFKEYYENYWAFAGYWHQDPTFWPDYYSRYVEWVFQAMARQYRYWVLEYSTYNHNDYWEKRFGKRWEQDINGGLAGALASYEAFNVLAGAFGRPAAGTYGFNKVTKRYEPFDDVNFNNYLNQIVMLEEDGARPIYPYWAYDGYLSVVVSAGSIYDRIAAFEALADPETDFMAVDEDSDTRKYLVNFGTVFPDDMNVLFGGLMANNADKYGWCVLTNEDEKPLGFAPRRFIELGGGLTNCADYYCAKQVEGIERTTMEVKPAANPGDPVDPCGAELTSKGFLPVGGQPIEPEPLYTFPTTRFRVPLLAAYYGMSLLVDNFDKSFMDATRIWLEGSKFSIEPPAGAEMATCEDRFSGRIYNAVGFNDGGYYPAYDLVSQCKLIFDCYDENVNVGMSDEEKDVCAETIGKSADAIGTLTLDNLRDEYLFHDLQYLVGKLELIRAMHSVYEYEYSGPMDVATSNDSPY